MTAGARYLFGRQRDPDTGDKTVTSDTWHVKGKYDYFFSPRFYGYLNGKVEQDNIANLDLRLTPGGGVGYQFAERPDVRYGITAMCIGIGMGGTVIWENPAWEGEK